MFFVYVNQRSKILGKVRTHVTKGIQEIRIKLYIHSGHTQKTKCLGPPRTHFMHLKVKNKTKYSIKTINKSLCNTKTFNTIYTKVNGSRV